MNVVVGLINPQRVIWGMNEYMNFKETLTSPIVFLKHTNERYILIVCAGIRHLNEQLQIHEFTSLKPKNK